MSSFPAFIARGHENTQIEEYVPGQATNEPFIPGDFVFVDTSDLGEAKRCGTNPTLIAGFAETKSEAHRVVTEDGRVPLRIIVGGGVVFGFASATQFVASTHVGNSYGITRSAAGFWLLDVAKTTTSSRVKVVGGDVRNNIWLGVIHANLLQFANLTVATA